MFPQLFRPSQGPSSPLRVPSSRDPSDESIWVGKASTQLLSHATVYYDFCPTYYDFCPMYYDVCHRTWSSGFKATQIVITFRVGTPMHCDFRHSTLACHAHMLWDVIVHVLWHGGHALWHWGHVLWHGPCTKTWGPWGPSTVTWEPCTVTCHTTWSPKYYDMTWNAHVLCQKGPVGLLYMGRQTKLLSHVTMYYDLRPMDYNFCPMYCDFCHSKWSSGFRKIVSTI